MMGPISETLFNVVEDAQMGLFRRPAVRRDSFGRDVLVSAAASAADTREEEEEEDVGKGGRKGSAGCGGYSKGRKMPTQRGVAGARLPTIRVGAARRVGPTPQNHSTPTKAAARVAVSNEVTGDDDDQEEDYVVLSSAHASGRHQISAQGGQVLPTTLGVDEILEYHRGGLTPSTSTTMTEVDDDIFHSLPSVDERLMDVSMPRSLMNDTTLMNTFDAGGSAQDERGYSEDESPSNTADILPTILNPNSSPQYINPPAQSHTHTFNTHPDSCLDTEAETRVSQLEQELRARTAELCDALRELANSRREYAFLAKRLEELEGEMEVAAAAASSTPSPPAPLSTLEGAGSGVPRATTAGGGVGGRGGRAGHFVEHLDENEDEELEDEYAAVYDLMKMKGAGAGGGVRKPVPRN